MLSQFRKTLTGFVVCMVVAGFAVVWAQTTGTIQGTVLDETGAVMPGVTVTIEHLETNTSRTLVTGERGHYQAPNLQVGRYRVSASLPGFKRATQTGLVLTVGGQLVVDLELAVGEVTEEVEVLGQSQKVDTTSSVLAELVDEEKIRELPLNGRDVMQLTTLQPGVTAIRTQRSNATPQPQTGTGLNITVAGVRPNNNNFRLDGISANDHANSTPGSAGGDNLGVDAVREFSILTNTFSAEHGRSSGGVVNMVLRSGTNEVHGSGFDFHRNDAMDARNFFDGPSVPEFRRHQFGGTLGGPIVKDRVFLFGSYEGLREFRGISSTSNVPTQAAREGNLESGRVEVDPAVKPFFDFFPLPNGPITGDSGVFTSSPNRIVREDFFVVRGDASLNEKNNLNASYTLDDASITSTDPLLVQDLDNPARRQILAGQLTTVISPRWINSFRMGYTRSFLVGGGSQGRTPELNDPALGFVPGQPVGVIGISGFTEFPGGTDANDTDSPLFESFQWYEDLTYTKGSHTFTFGGNIEYIFDRFRSTNRTNGDFSFPSLEDFLANRPDRFRSQFADSDAERFFRQEIYGVYFQDRFRVTPNLTLNLGLRWEFATNPQERDGEEVKFPNSFNTRLDERIIGKGFTETPKLNLQPRVGFAWDPFGGGRVAVRGGFGIFTDLPLVNVLSIPALRTAPFFARGSVSGLEPGDFPTRGFDKLNALRQDTILDADILEPNPDSAYVMQYNLNIQTEVARNTVLTVGYVGSRGVKLLRITEDANLAFPVIRDDGRLFFPAGQDKRNPDFGRIGLRQWDGSSFYNAFQAGLNRRFTDKLRIQASLTLAKSVDDASTTFSSNQFGNTVNNPFFEIRELNRGLSDFHTGAAFVLNGAYELPNAFQGPAGQLLNGWKLGVIFNYTSGTPVTATIGADRARTLTLRRGSLEGQRPDLVGTENNARAESGDKTLIFDNSAFAVPEPGVLGNLGRNTIIGPGLRSTDFSLTKNFELPFREGMRLEFKTEFFNLFNKTSLAIPDSSRREVFNNRGEMNSDPGRSTSTTVNSREIQFGLKLIF